MGIKRLIPYSCLQNCELVQLLAQVPDTPSMRGQVYYWCSFSQIKGRSISTSSPLPSTWSRRYLWHYSRVFQSLYKLGAHFCTRNPKATSQEPSTTPGPDELTAHFIRSKWPSFGKLITNLFEQCEKYSAHPKSFKLTNFIILLKTTKVTTASQNNTALLLFHLVKYDILAHNKWGVISRHLVVDLITALDCDTKSARKSRKSAGIISVNFYGPFKGAHCNHLLFRQRTQGCL